MAGVRRAVVLRALLRLILGLLSLMTPTGMISKRVRAACVCVLFLFPFSLTRFLLRLYSTRSVSFHHLFGFIFFTSRDLRTASLAFCWLVGDGVWLAGTGRQRSVCV
jgi:hypothetical protein